MDKDIKPVYHVIVKEIHKHISLNTFSDVNEALKPIRKKFKLIPRKDIMTHVYTDLVKKGQLTSNATLDRYFVKLPVRSWSGVLVVTIVLRPDKFSCPFDCKYCPNETIANGADINMPRSYLSSEPAVMRAMRENFDIFSQFNSRVNMLRQNGHSIDKVEIIVLGGTFSSYPRDYQVEAMRDIFYASNTFFEPRDERYSLQHEQQINETAKLKIIGISLETRPDFINPYELRRFRELGCTRIQIGVQHTNDDILKIVNRKHDVGCSIRAIRLMKNFGFKVDVHVMPDLPGATPELDKHMFQQVFQSEHFKPDYVKIYPCLDITYSEIRKWKQSQKWIPYSEENGGKKLIDLILYVKENLIDKYVRINRIQRDFPEEHVKNGFKGFVSDTIKSNLRQLIENQMKDRGTKCKCIRCREVKNNNFDMENIRMNISEYFASEGKEIFLSFDDSFNDLLIGFVRLRLPGLSENHSVIALRNAALIRELHVYGSIKAVHDKSKSTKPQHRGFGKELIRAAENVAFKNGYRNIAIISGVGVREYYRQQGYTLENTYMIKKLTLFLIIQNFIVLTFKTLTRSFSGLRRRLNYLNCYPLFQNNSS